MENNNIEIAQNFTTRIVQEIKKELVIGGGDLDLYVRCYLDNDLVVDKKADSVLAGFLHALFVQMNGMNYRSMPDLRTVDDIFWGNNLHPIFSISSISGSVIRLSVSSGNGFQAIPGGSPTGLCSIQGVLGTSSLIDGTYPYSTTAGSNSAGGGINRFDIDLSAITASPITAGYIANSGTIRQSVLMPNPNSGPSTTCFNWPTLVVGSGSAVVTIQDSMLEKEIQHGTTVGRLNMSNGNSPNYTQVFPDQPAGISGSEIWFQRIFQNTSTGSCNISEIGLYAVYGQLAGQGYLLMMRDVIPTISIDPTRTLTVQYYLRSNLSTGTNPGGFLLNFMKILKSFSMKISAISSVFA